MDDVNYVAYNLAGYSAYSQIRKSYYSANATASFATSIDANTGTITIAMSASQTANIAPGRYVYDTTLTDPTGIVSRILEGIAEFSPSVTR